MSGRALVRGGLLLVAAVLLSPSQARAGVILITHGDTISHIGEVAPEFRSPKLPQRVGFKSSYFGVFWIDLWTWGGEFCAYEGDRYQPISRAEAARLIGMPRRAASVT